MAQATRHGHLTFSDHVERVLREGAMWTLMCVALYLVLSLASYAPDDPGWSYVGETAEVTEATEPTGLFRQIVEDSHRILPLFERRRLRRAVTAHPAPCR